MPSETHLDIIGLPYPDNIRPAKPELTSPQKNWRAKRLADENNRRKEQPMPSHGQLNQLSDEQREANRAGFAALRQQLAGETALSQQVTVEPVQPELPFPQN